jgi:hypothetical protein
MTVRLWCRCVAMAGIAFALAAACSGPRSGASATTAVSGCAAVLPLARETVHDEGTLILVRRISRSDADALSRELGATPPLSSRSYPGPPGPHPPGPSRGPKVCLVVYRGSYPKGTITGASPPAVAGRYALIVLRVRHPSLERVLVTSRLPRGLNLSKLGP